MSAIAIVKSWKDLVPGLPLYDENGVYLKHQKPKCRPLFLSRRPKQRAAILPEERQAALARYQFDHAAISNQSDPIGIVEDLVAATGDPGWSQVRACKHCYDWDGGQSLTRPRPPRAEDASSGCAGCTWSYIDGTDSSLLRQEERLQRLLKLEASWVKQLRVHQLQSVAYSWCPVRKRFVENERESSYRRYRAKVQELKACQALIHRLLLAEEKEIRRTEPMPGRPFRSRGIVRKAEYVANRLVATE